MCEAPVYLMKNCREELVLENIDRLECWANQIYMVNIFGEEKRIAAKIKILSLIDHKIILEPA